MKSFFKKETKEDKERKRQKKHGELSFNTTPSPDFVDSTDSTNDILIESTQYYSESSQNAATTVSLKLQSNSRTSIDSQQTPTSQQQHPPTLPKPKKGILKTMSKFGIGPTLANLSSSSATPNSTSPTASQPPILRNASTNLPIVSSPKQVKYSPQSKLLIENSITNYSKRSSQVVTGHSLNELESFMLPVIRKLPDLGSDICGNSDILKSLVRCVDVTFEQLIQHIVFTETERNTILLTCDLPRYN